MHKDSLKSSDAQGVQNRTMKCAVHVQLREWLQLGLCILLQILSRISLNIHMMLLATQLPFCRSYTHTKSYTVILEQRNPVQGKCGILGEWSAWKTVLRRTVNTNYWRSCLNNGLPTSMFWEIKTFYDTLASYIFIHKVVYLLYSELTSICMLQQSSI
jgi:hypothetical protein